jgi:hypothetical protein
MLSLPPDPREILKKKTVLMVGMCQKNSRPRQILKCWPQKGTWGMMWSKSGLVKYTLVDDKVMDSPSALARSQHPYMSSKIGSK